MHLAEPIAPHIAAQKTGTEIRLEPILEAAQQLQQQSQQLVVEGVGGWRVPLNARQSLVDLVKALQAEVILVVGLRLGCINHAVLSSDVIHQDDCVCRGWIANTLNPGADDEAVLDSLRERFTYALIRRVTVSSQA